MAKIAPKNFKNKEIDEMVTNEEIIEAEMKETEVAEVEVEEVEKETAITPVDKEDFFWQYASKEEKVKKVSKLMGRIFKMKNWNGKSSSVRISWSTVDARGNLSNFSQDMPPILNVTSKEIANRLFAINCHYKGAIYKEMSKELFDEKKQRAKMITDLSSKLSEEDLLELLKAKRK